MSDHLPECFAANGLDLLNPLTQVCICDRLRQAEQRGHGNRLEAWAEGYAFALTAAREAVADALGPNSPGGSIALAAIDALRGSGNPDTPPSAEKGEQP